MRELELMGTLGCHLCEVAEQLLVQSVDPQRFAVYQVDIADDEQLLDRYAQTIPVLLDVASGQELLWPFDLATLQQFLNRLEQT